MRYELKISNYKLLAFLGNNDWEQKQKRPVVLSISILFVKPPAACFNDQLEDTVCYSTLLRYVNEAINDKRFKLIENLAQMIFDTVKRAVQEKGAVSVEISKSAPIANLESASFKITEDVQ